MAGWFWLKVSQEAAVRGLLGLGGVEGQTGVGGCACTPQAGKSVPAVGGASLHLHVGSPQDRSYLPAAASLITNEVQRDEAAVSASYPSVFKELCRFAHYAHPNQTL